MKKTSLTLAIVSALTLSACGGSSDSDDQTPTTPTNATPTDITLSNASVDENTPGAAIGALSATDADASDTHTFTVDNENLTVNGAELSLATEFAANYEAAETITTNVTVTDSAGNSYTKELTINVNDLLDTYTFNSEFVEGESSVSYSGQTARHALIAELNHYIGNQLQADIDSGALTSKQDVLDKLNLYFRTTEQQYQDNFALKSFTNASQEFIVNISSGHKTLVGKLAGNDETGQHKDWTMDFSGWNGTGTVNPEGLVDIFFEQLASNAEEVINGTVRTLEDGTEISVYLNTDGTDLKQLIQKFLLMAITYSQGTDDYLDNNIDNKGLLTDNISAVDGKNYTNLEHQFDEGFGYFGAARDYLEYSDDEIASKDGRADWQGQHDTNGDGKIDLTSEINFGQSVNAAKRDRGATVATDFTQTTMEAFIAGRKLINDAAGAALTEAQMTELLGYRDAAVDGWEKAIAATVVHYINDTNSDLDKLGTDDFEYADLAKHWSEMKGFALGLQFNPHSDISDSQFQQIHALMGTAPVLESADVPEYKAGLIQARGIIAEALEFNAENVANW